MDDVNVECFCNKFVPEKEDGEMEVGGSSPVQERGS